jgi:hypothetical protein
VAPSPVAKAHSASAPVLPKKVVEEVGTNATPVSIRELAGDPAVDELVLQRETEVEAQNEVLREQIARLQLYLNEGIDAIDHAERPASEAVLAIDLELQYRHLINLSHDSKGEVSAAKLRKNRKQFAQAAAHVEIDDQNRVEEFFINKRKEEAKQKLADLQQEEADLLEQQCDLRDQIARLEHQKKTIEEEVEAEKKKAARVVEQSKVLEAELVKLQDYYELAENDVRQKRIGSEEMTNAHNTLRKMTTAHKSLGRINRMLGMKVAYLEALKAQHVDGMHAVYTSILDADIPEWRNGRIGWADGLKDSAANLVAKDYVPVSGYQCPPIAADFLTFVIASRGEKAYEFLSVHPAIERQCALEMLARELYTVHRREKMALELHIELEKLRTMLEYTDVLPFTSRLMQKFTGAAIGVVWMIDHSRRVRWTQVKRKRDDDKKDGVGGADVLEINSPQETGILGTVFSEASKPDGKRALFLEDATAHPAYASEYDFALDSGTPTKTALVVAIGAPDPTAAVAMATAPTQHSSERVTVLLEMINKPEKFDGDDLFAATIIGHAAVQACAKCAAKSESGTKARREVHMINFLEVLGGLKNAEDIIRALSTYLRQLFVVNDVVFHLMYEDSFESFRLRDGKPIKRQHGTLDGIAGRVIDQLIDVKLEPGDGNELWKMYDAEVDARCDAGDAMQIMISKRGRICSCAVQWTIPKGGMQGSRKANVDVLQRFISTLGDVVEVQFPLLERMESTFRKKLRSKSQLMHMLSVHRKLDKEKKEEEEANKAKAEEEAKAAEEAAKQAAEEAAKAKEAKRMADSDSDRSAAA